MARKAKLQPVSKVMSQACAKPGSIRSDNKSVQHKSYDCEEAAASGGVLQMHAGANQLKSGEFGNILIGRDFDCLPDLHITWILISPHITWILIRKNTPAVLQQRMSNGLLMQHQVCHQDQRVDSSGMICSYECFLPWPKTSNMFTHCCDVI